MNPLVIVELVLRIVLTAMEGQTPEQRAKIWDRHIENMEQMDTFFNKLLKLDKPNDQAGQVPSLPGAGLID